MSKGNTTAFDAITKDKPTLAGFLRSLPCIEAPWDAAFQKRYCSSCTAENCDASLIGNGRDHRMQKNKMPVPTEAQEQMTLFSWAAMQSGKYPELNLLYHVPNGGSRHKAEAGRLRAEGVKAGVPDLCLPVARGQYHGLYIELKRQRGGRTSDHQSEWLDALSAQGYKAALCYGWEQAAGTIIEYLTGGGTHD